MGNNETVEETEVHGAENEEKTFTQEDVDRIVEERLEEQQREASEALKQRESDVKAREQRIECKEYLLDRCHPMDLLDILDTNDVEQFKTMVDKLNGVYGKRQVAPPLASSELNEIGAYYEDKRTSDAFRKPSKHTPKQYQPGYGYE